MAQDQVIVLSACRREGHHQDVILQSLYFRIRDNDVPLPGDDVQYLQTNFDLNGSVHPTTQFTRRGHHLRGSDSERFEDPPVLSFYLSQSVDVLFHGVLRGLYRLILTIIFRRRCRCFCDISGDVSLLVVLAPFLSMLLIVVRIALLPAWARMTFDAKGVAPAPIDRI